MAQRERQLISERTKSALAAARARGNALGGNRGYRPPAGPDARAAALARQDTAERPAHCLVLKVEALRREGLASHADIARALTVREVPTPRGNRAWTHTTVARLLTRAAASVHTSASALTL
jgi:DNA invertase Pin-like site-specific DNA recombinase